MRLTVKSITKVEGPQRVYNLEVASLDGQITHNYFVGEDEIWTHNTRLFRGKKRRDVMAKNDGKCVRCGDIADQADHIIPHCQGGPTIVGNGQPLCGSCNTKKSGKSPIAGLDLAADLFGLNK